MRTDIIRVEFVHAHANSDRRRAERPTEQRAEGGELAFVDVVHQDRIKLSHTHPTFQQKRVVDEQKERKKTHANVAVHDEAEAEEPVEEGCGGAGSDECGCGKRDEAGGEKALERPVVRAVRLGGRREGRRVVRCSLVDRCTNVNTQREGGREERTTAGNVGKVVGRAACCGARLYKSEEV